MSLQPGSLVTHPLLYSTFSREELLARIAELERGLAKANVNSIPGIDAVPNSATSSVGKAVASSSSSSSGTTKVDQPPATISTIPDIASTSTPSAASSSQLPQTKADRKAILKKARLNTSAGLSNETGTGALNGDDFFSRYGTRKIALRFSYEGWLHGGLALQMEEPPSGVLPKRSMGVPASLSSSSSSIASKDTSSSSSSSAKPTMINALPTVEGVLLDALVAARLIRESDKRDLEKLEFSRCGRTDRGVSAAGQVVSLYVRSQLKEEDGKLVPGWRAAEKPALSNVSSSEPVSLGESEKVAAPAESNNCVNKNKGRAELPYMSLLNRFLPSSIRILAWSPVDYEFDARFSCRYRHYKYFFAAPRSSRDSSVESGNGKERQRDGTLNVERMQEAASRLVGEHDFRNLCKVDATKQITSFYRRVMSATISPVNTSSIPVAISANDAKDEEYQEDMYVFDLRGGAFLYHQVRHIMAVLFLVGSGREDPSVIDALLNTGYQNERTARASALAAILADSPEINFQSPSSINHDQDSECKSLPIVPSKPAYEMASDLPLLLWDCFYPSSAGLKWQQDELIAGRDLHASKGYVDMMVGYNQLRIKEVLSRHFLRSYLETGSCAAAVKHENEQEQQEMMTAVPVTGSEAGNKKREAKRMVKDERIIIQLGAGKTATMGKYTPLLERPRSSRVEVVNQRWMDSQGKRRAEKKAKAGEEVKVLSGSI